MAPSDPKLSPTKHLLLYRYLMLNKNNRIILKMLVSIVKCQLFILFLLAAVLWTLLLDNNSKTILKKLMKVKT